jgi:hypothetical protein
MIATILIWFYSITAVIMLICIICMIVFREKVRFFLPHEWIGHLSVPVIIYVLTLSNPWGWFWAIMAFNFGLSIVVLCLNAFGHTSWNIFVPWFWREAKQT